MAATLSTANGSARALVTTETAYLLGVAREAVEAYLQGGRRPEVRPQDLPSKRMAEEGACFVTIYYEGRLRGCIGSLEPHRPLVFDVIENALSSAFEDPRFVPVSKDELCRLRFSISVLSQPRRIRPSGPAELLDSLVPARHGLIIQKGLNRATFLPVVWDMIPDKEEFLSHLCVKAGLQPDEWRDTRSMEFYIYEAQEFMEMLD